MPNETLIEEVEESLILQLKAKLPDIKAISALTEQDFDEDDRIIAATPAIRVLMRAEQLTPGADAQRLTYDSAQNWMALCGAQRPTTFDKERAAALLLVTRVKAALAGAKLPLPSNTYGAVVALAGAELFQLGPEGTWYAVACRVESVTQFTANMT